MSLQNRTTITKVMKSRSEVLGSHSETQEIRKNRTWKWVKIWTLV